VKAESKTVAKLPIEKVNLDVSGPSGRTLHDAVDSGAGGNGKMPLLCNCKRKRSLVIKLLDQETDVGRLSEPHPT
jgi:hypothetical protein